MSDATIASWHKKVGDSVKRDENLVDLETDKVVLEVPSPADGVLKEIKFDTGATVTSQQVIAVIEEGAVADAPKADQAVFLHYCQRTGLDPFARQIYMIGRWSREGTKYTIQTSIDGFRLIGRRAADARHEQLEVSDTEWCGPDGQWRDVWLSDEPPAAARVSVIRNGGRFPAVALFREYAQTKKDGALTQMWADKGALMIAKCAEALAWRKAFPQDLSGLYTGDEMSQADTHRAPIPAV